MLQMASDVQVAQGRGLWGSRLEPRRASRSSSVGWGWLGHRAGRLPGLAPPQDLSLSLDSGLEGRDPSGSLVLGLSEPHKDLLAIQVVWCLPTLHSSQHPLNTFNERLLGA